MTQGQTQPKYCQISCLLFDDCPIQMESAAQIMTVPELFIYKSGTLKVIPGCVCYIVHLYA